MKQFPEYIVKLENKNKTQTTKKHGMDWYVMCTAICVKRRGLENERLMDSQIGRQILRNIQGRTNMCDQTESLWRDAQETRFNDSLWGRKMEDKEEGRLLTICHCILLKFLCACINVFFELCEIGFSGCSSDQCFPRCCCFLLT